MGVLLMPGRDLSLALCTSRDVNVYIAALEGEYLGPLLQNCYTLSVNNRGQRGQEPYFISEFIDMIGKVGGSLTLYVGLRGVQNE